MYRDFCGDDKPTPLEEIGVIPLHLPFQMCLRPDYINERTLCRVEASRIIGRVNKKNDLHVLFLIFLCFHCIDDGHFAADLKPQ